MNLADSAFSGSKELRKAVCFATAAALAFNSGSSSSSSFSSSAEDLGVLCLGPLVGVEVVAVVDVDIGNCISPSCRSDIIWSAIFLRSDERNGASGLIL